MKPKQSKNDDGNLAADHGRTKRKGGGEPQKETGAPRGSARRTGSSKKK